MHPISSSGARVQRLTANIAELKEGMNEHTALLQVSTLAGLRELVESET